MKNQLKHCWDPETKRDMYAYLAGVKEDIFIYFCPFCGVQFEVPAGVPKKTTGRF